jgi:hypothetical protein
MDQPFLEKRCSYCGKGMVPQNLTIKKPVPYGAKDLGITENQIAWQCPNCENVCEARVDFCRGCYESGPYIDEDALWVYIQPSVARTPRNDGIRSLVSEENGPFCFGLFLVLNAKRRSDSKVLLSGATPIAIHIESFTLRVRQSELFRIGKERLIQP